MSPGDDLAYVKGKPLEIFPSVYYHLEKGLESNPEGPAISIDIVVPYQPRDHLQQLVGVTDWQSGTTSEYLVWTHTQLRRAAVQVASGLIARGIQRGSMLVTLMPNRVEILLLRYATAICGATFAPLDFGAVNEARSNELRNLMIRLKPDAIFVANLDDAASVDLAIEFVQQPPPKTLVVLDEPSKSDTSNWMSLLDLTSGEVIAKEREILQMARLPDPDRIDLMMFTSGTSSGNPKACPRHARGNATCIYSQADIFPFNKDSRYLLTSAYFRIIAPVMSVAVWSKGGAVVMPSPLWDPKSVMRAVQDHSITHILFVPFQLHALTRDDSFASEKTISVKYAVFGADIITKELLKKAKRSFPTANIAAGHGMTEGGAAFSWPYYEAGVDAIPEYRGISALGTAAPGVALRIYDIDNNRVAKRNEPGEFQISSPTTIKNYLEDVDQEVFLQEGPDRWFKTGDVGLMNGDGVIFLLGRLNDRIKRAGIRITPAALESSLSEYVGAQVSVFGIPHPELGQEPYIVAESLGNKTEEQIKQRVVDVFGEASTPAGACTLHQLGLSQFPLNAAGKIMKFTLRDAVVKYLGRQSML